MKTGISSYQKYSKSLLPMRLQASLVNQTIKQTVAGIARPADRDRRYNFGEPVVSGSVRDTRQLLLS